MSEISSNYQTEKYHRLHKLAMSLYENGQFKPALNCWLKIQIEAPQYPNLNYWINQTRKKMEDTSEDVNSRKALRSAYKMQLEIAERYGHRIAAKHRFRVKPHPPKVSILRRIKHRYIALVLIIFGLLVTWASVRNMRHFLIVLEPRSGKLMVYQGMFFPYGWDQLDSLNIGLIPGWEEELESNDLKVKLRSGMRIHGSSNLDSTILDLYRRLGHNALKKQSVEKQQEAIYYFSRIEKANFSQKVAWDMASAYFNLASLHLKKNRDPQSAQKFLSNVTRYVPNYPGIDTLKSQIESFNFKPF